MSSFRVFTSNLKDKIIETQYGFVYLSCLLLDKCQGVDNVRIPFTPRVQGRSNYNLIKLIKLYLKLQLNYGLLRSVFKNVLKANEPAFDVLEMVENKQQGVSKNEGHDAGWGAQISCVQLREL